MDTEAIKAIVQLGFAVFVALFLLVRFERTIKALTTAIYRSSDMQLQAIQQLGAIIREEKGIPQPPVHIHKRRTDSDTKEHDDA